MEARIDIITLAVADLERALEFYRDGLGLESRGIIGTEWTGDDVEPAGAIALFELPGGLIFSLYPAPSWRRTPRSRSVRRRPASSASDTQSQAKPRSTRCSAKPRPLVPRLPIDRMTVHGGSTPATFAIPTDTYGRSSTTHGSSARRSNAL
jgi:hypothetical protein